VCRDSARPIDDEEAVRSRLKRRLQQGTGLLEFDHRISELCDVPAAAGDADRLSFVVCDHVASDVQQADCAIFPDNPVFELKWGAPAQRVEECALCSLCIVRMNALEECFISTLELSRFQSMDALEFVGPGHDVGFDVPFETSDVRHAL